MTTETKEETVATPATTTSVEQVTAVDTTTTTADTTTANETKVVDTATTSVGDANTKGSKDTKDSKDGLPKGVKTRLWEQAEKIRKLEAEIAKMTATPAPTTNPTATTDTTAQNDTGVNLLDDPDKWAGSIENKILSKAEANILAKLQKAEAEKKILSEASEAKEYLLSQPELSDDGAITELQSILATPEVQALCAVSPKKGADYGLYLFRKAKGLDTESVNKAKINAAQSASVTPAGVSAGKKVWDRKEIAKYLDYKHPDFATRKAEIDLAISEGRIK